MGLIKNKNSIVKKSVIILFLIFLSYPAFSENKTIIISGTNWAPYTEEKLPNGGFFTEICLKAFEETGYKTEVKFVPWKRAVEMTKKGKYHALMGASYTDNREEYFSYPRYYWEISVHFFARKNHRFSYRKVEDLCPARLGIFSGSFYVERFKAYKCFTIDTVPTIQQNIQKLVANRIDLFLDSKDSVFFYLNSELSYLADKIVPLSPPLEADKIYIVVSKKLKNHKKISDDFDRGITIIKNNGTYGSILKKHGMY